MTRPLLPFGSALLILVSLAAAMLLHAAGRSTPVAVPRVFPHAPHAAYGCVTCHHDVQEARFQSWPEKQCVACHLSTPVLRAGIQETFHHFCESCHRQERCEGLKAGPVVECSGCHFNHVPPVKGTFVLR